MKSFLFVSKTIVAVCTVLLFSVCYLSSITAQNLLENIRNGKEIIINTTPNNISKWVKAQRADLEAKQYDLFELSLEKTKQQSEVEKAVYLTLQTAQLQALASTKVKALNLTIPVSKGQSFELELVQVRNVTDQFDVKTSENAVFTQEKVGGVFYRGIVKGMPNSAVALSVFPNHLRALIAGQGDRYVLGELGKEKGRIGTDYILYAASDLTTPSQFECKLEVDEEKIKPIQLSKIQALEKTDGVERCLKVYVEADFSTFRAFGFDAIATARYVQGMFNEVAMVYQLEDIVIELNQVFVWTSMDPYADLRFSFDILNAFWLEKTRTGFDGNYAHLLSARIGPQGIAAGFDCTSPLAVTGIQGRFSSFPTYSEDVLIFAHEMGHNLGSGHTHGCYWNTDTYGNGTQIDDCGNASQTQFGFQSEGSGCIDDPFNPIIPEEKGTIMSYCDIFFPIEGEVPGVDFINGFGPQPGNVIRINYNNPPAGCATVCEPQGNLNCTSIGNIEITEESINISDIVIENQGDFPIAPSNLGLYFSTDPLVYPGVVRSFLQFAATDALVGTAKLDGINSGESQTIDAAIDISDKGLFAGEYFVGAFPNYDRTVDESNLGDNGMIFPNQRVVLEANLTCQTSGTLKIDDSVVSVTDLVIGNDGLYATDVNFVGYYLSLDTIVGNQGDIFIGNSFVAPLAAGQSTTVNFTTDLSSRSINPGSYYVGLIVDAFGLVRESNEGDNFDCFISEELYTVEAENQFCNSRLFTDQSGIISDGSGAADYQNNAFCRDFIIPEGGGRIELDFSELDVQTAFDFLVFFDGIDLTFGNFVAAFTGDVVPDSTIVTNDTLQILFISNGGITADGWTANYQNFKAVDLELSISSTPSVTAPFQKREYLFEVSNTGAETATNIEIVHDLANGRLLTVAGAEAKLSKGAYSQVSRTWTIDQLNAGESATLSLVLFNISADFDLFAQITAMDQDDIDSTPDNGTCCTALEDDEAVFNPSEASAASEVASRNTPIGVQLAIPSVHPNPVSDQATVLFFSELNEVTYTLQDASGKLIQQNKWQTTEGFNAKTIDITAFKAGIYYLRIGQVAPVKIVKVE